MSPFAKVKVLALGHCCSVGEGTEKRNRREMIKGKVIKGGFIVVVGKRREEIENYTTKVEMDSCLGDMIVYPKKGSFGMHFNPFKDFFFFFFFEVFPFVLKWVP